MASVFTHGFFAASAAKLFFPEKLPFQFWLAVFLCAFIPDIDVIGFYLGIRYGDLLGHRGLTHSLFFALIVAVVAARALSRFIPNFSNRRLQLAVYFFSVTASHGLLDAMTSGGYGVAFFSPFDVTRFFLPWRPLKVSPIGVYGFFGRLGWDVIWSEFLWIWLPMLFALGLVVGVRAIHPDKGTPN